MNAWSFMSCAFVLHMDVHPDSSTTCLGLEYTPSTTPSDRRELTAAAGEKNTCLEINPSAIRSTV